MLKYLNVAIHPTTEVVGILATDFIKKLQTQCFNLNTRLEYTKPERLREHYQNQITKKKNNIIIKYTLLDEANKLYHQKKEEIK